MIVKRWCLAFGLEFTLCAPGGYPRGLMRYRRMQRVKLILHEEFPIRVLHYAMTDGDNLDFPDRRSITHIVECNLRYSQEFDQAGAARRQSRKDEATVAVHLRRRFH